MNSTQGPQPQEKNQPAQFPAPNWTYVLDDAALLEGHMAPVFPLGVNVLLARVGGAVYAVSGNCAHMACPLYAGRLEGYTIICGCHDWNFDVRTGKFLKSPELGLTVYLTKLESGKLFVNLTGKVIS
ncbi:MAG TPA: Rieske (2Fe-2S) protein [Candidatus Acidoferrales bacterium]|jgi:3-phenylpropionate/trans-cinnamate dioxygenase ferredoxin subunit|nr:Rieske (2Fe-2S) protein [Candidatus Acidoferrales bacterium]